MTRRNFRIRTYRVDVTRPHDWRRSDTDIVPNIVATIICKGGPREELNIFFCKDSEENIPPNFTNFTDPWTQGTIFVQFELYPSFLDLLRNEKPIYAILESDTPILNRISTSLEPVGDGE